MTSGIRRFLLPPGGALAIALVTATAALATTTISIKSSQVPVKASEFSEHDDCNFPGHTNQSPPMYGWHFVLPGGEATFVSLTAHFQTAGDVTLPGPSGGFVQDGKGAVIYTATDDTLTGAEATIEGTTPQGDFVLSHTCLPAPSQSPSASASASTSSSPSPEVSASETTSPSPEVSASDTTSPSPGASVSASGQVSPSISPSVKGVKLTRPDVRGGNLATTGISVLGLVVLAGLLISAGVALQRGPKGRHTR